MTIIVLSALTAAGCTKLPEIGGMPLPKISQRGPTTYRNLADIPEAPDVSPVDADEAAMRMLSQERSATARAAGQLRGEPFIMPMPAPVVMPIEP